MPDEPGVKELGKYDEKETENLLYRIKTMWSDKHAKYTDAEAIAAVGAQVAVGSYTGDGTASRQIETGFQCKAVIVQRDTTQPDTWITLSTSWSLEFVIGAAFATETALKLHASDGFIVDGANGNNNTHSYNYLAVGE